MALFERKSKLPGNNPWGYIEVNRALFELVANEFVVEISNSCNNPLGINNASEILGRGCCKGRLRQ